MTDNDKFWQRLTEPENSGGKQDHSFEEYSKWLRQPLEDSTADEQEISARITACTRELEAAAQAEMDAYLRVGKRRPR